MAQQSERVMGLISEIKPQDELYVQQTSMTSAVQWLFEQVENLDWKNLIDVKKIEIFEQAKQMEKEQIINDYKHGQNNGYMYRDGSSIYIDAEQYYNETYGKE